MSATTRNRLGIWAACLLTFAATSFGADLLQMQNGDHYSGRIISMTTNSIVLESDMLGKVTLPRDKVSSITMGLTISSNTATIAKSTNSTPGARHPATAPVANADVTAALRRMGANTNFIQQVRQQMLTGADPAANQKYDALVSGLMSGQMNVNDIRNEAKKGIDQIHKLKQELGPQADESLDSYLTILENFVNETESGTGSQTAPVPSASFGTNSSMSLSN